MFSLQPEEWRLVRANRLNALFVGPKHATVALVSTLRQTLLKPVVEIALREPLVLPEPDRVGTLVLHDIQTFGPADQRRLMTWLDGVRARTQVISTAPAPMLPMIVTGAFNAALYYRLNVLYVELASMTSDSGQDRSHSR